ncbi:phospholipase [Legionella spiritensis]|uniref:phospholipase n=1 Tax=Legionella spiritensis TaxID=452 RepID=UPI000F6E7AD4|nr:phospholipase [Legionella spiritensis]VEG91713.1 phosphatidylcholine hydrolyzing phospholipase [Legionella spiritensis]
MKLFWLLVLLINATIPAYADQSFALSEHLAAGQQVLLKFDPQTPGEKNTLLHLNNGLAVTYGHIISLGDLFGVVGKPVALGKNQTARRQRFLAAFATLAEETSAVTEAIQLNQVIANELKTIEDARKAGESPEEVYRRIGNEVGRQINCITGGGCTSSGWWLVPGRYLKLAMKNYDHFSPFAEIAYITGHQLAIEQAIRAHHSGKRGDLEQAYALDALACHYLSDLFAAGHLRTPRRELQEQITPEVVGSLLANYMHNEENEQGIPVHNGHGHHWSVFGDFSYFNSANKENRQQLANALQHSVDDIFTAYYQGYSAPATDNSGDIPQADEYGPEAKEAISALFYWDQKRKKLMRRKDITNPHDQSWTDNWWGWSTLLALKKHYGVEPDMQPYWKKLIHERAETKLPASERNTISYNSKKPVNDKVYGKK